MFVTNESRIFTLNERSVVTIVSKINDNTSAFGTGFFISKDGKVLTSSHNVINAIEVYIYAEGQLFRANEITNNTRFDVAIYKIEIESKAITFATYIEPNQLCFTISSTSDRVDKFCRSGTVHKETFVTSEVIDSILTTVQLNKGMSGCPLFDIKGDCIGMLGWYMQSLNSSGGISMKVIKNVIEKEHTSVNFKSKGLGLHNILAHNIPIEGCYGEIVTDSNNSDVNVNDVILSVNDQKVGIDDVSVESLTCFKCNNNYVNVRMMKFNGKSWNKPENIRVSLSKNEDKEFFVRGSASFKYTH